MSLPITNTPLTAKNAMQSNSNSFDYLLIDIPVAPTYTNSLDQAPPDRHASRLSLTHLRVRLLNSLGSSLHCFAASIFAGLSSFGLLSMLLTESKMDEGVCTGDQRSAVDS